MNLKIAMGTVLPSQTSGRTYQTPRLVDFGRVERLTMGHGGSSLDGNCTMTQLGGGNDPDGGDNPQSCK